MGEEIAMQQEILEVSQVASLPFGVGNVGADRHLVGAEKTAYAAALGRHQHEVPAGLWLPFDCMDEREILSLADGTSDPTILMQRRAFQNAGGTVLGFTKAAVAADAAYLRGTKNIREAYEKTYEVVLGFGIPDAAHDGCGASALVQKSVNEPVDLAVALQTFAALGASEETVRGPLEKLAANKKQRLEAGFYESWDPAWHKEFVMARNPENFSTLRTEGDDVKGHHASGLLLVSGRNYFSKNAFIAETGRQAFALTLDAADEVAHMLGVSDQERALISLALRDDSFNVANHIVAQGLETYA